MMGFNLVWSSQERNVEFVTFDFDHKQSLIVIIVGPISFDEYIDRSSK